VLGIRGLPATMFSVTKGFSGWCVCCKTYCSNGGFRCKNTRIRFRCRVLSVNMDKCPFVALTLRGVLIFSTLCCKILSILIVCLYVVRYNYIFRK